MHAASLLRSASIPMFPVRVQTCVICQRFLYICAGAFTRASPSTFLIDLRGVVDSMAMPDLVDQIVYGRADAGEVLVNFGICRG